MNTIMKQATTFIYIHIYIYKENTYILFTSLPNVLQFLRVVLYGCETWSVTPREEHGLWLLQNRVLRRIFGPRRNEVTGDWRRLRNEELCDLYCSPNIIRVIKSRRMRWTGHVACMGERRGVARF